MPQSQASPQKDNDEVQYVPAAPQVGVLVEEEAVGDDLHGGFDGEDDEEEILQFLLWEQRWSSLLSPQPSDPADPQCPASGRWLPL